MAVWPSALENVVKLASLTGVFGERRVLVTGHTGFKGAWLCLWLARLKARVVGVALEPPSQPNLYDVAQVKDVLEADIRCDVRDESGLRTVLDSYPSDLIVHMAAQSLVRRSYCEPRQTFDVNVMGVVSVLEAVRKEGRPCAVIIVTSDKCYDNPPDGAAHREDDPMGGDDPYSASKGAAELVVDAYRKSFFDPMLCNQHGVKLASVRAGNVVGGGDWAEDRILPDAVRALSQGRAVPVRSPNSVRPWQHVLDCLAGYLMLGERLLMDQRSDWCGPWNFGTPPEDEARVQDVVEAFCRAWGGGRWVDASDASQPPESAILKLRSDKAQQALGWCSRWHWREAVERAARWYRRYYTDPTQNMREWCWREISEYVEER